MNIEQAKTEIKRTAAIYLMKDQYGNYRMEKQHQRPIFMLGAPGIGKTAVAAQIAEEMKLPLVSYSMTHHTRQSAIGLPLIEHRTYQGREFDVSVYTLSEIIASVYDAMEKSGKKEGILFLDEINCVSETLAPVMLQFLQYKTFGNHELPAGWILITAGNPQIYNRNARAFDIATLDRLKILEVEPDYHAWKRYAQNAHVHPSILSFLDIHPDDCFHIESGIDGKIYVTPRGWEDLSNAMILYSEKNFPVDENLIGQYLHDERIVNAFASYLMLFGKYQADYPIGEILEGNTSETIRERMRKAGWDERISVTNMMLDSLSREIHDEQVCENALRMMRDALRGLKEKDDLASSLAELMEDYQKEMERMTSAMDCSSMEKESLQYALSFLHHNNGLSEYDLLADHYRSAASLMQKQAEMIEKHLKGMFSFLKECASEQEILIAVTRLTTDQNNARFISLHGCDDYYAYNDILKMDKRSEEMMKEIHEFRGQND